MTRSSNCIWFTTLDEKIKSIKDFSGKRVGLGRRSQTHWALFTSKAIQDGSGVTGRKSCSISATMPPPPRCLTAKVDVAVGSCHDHQGPDRGVPIRPGPQAGATGRKFYHIPIPNAVTEKVNKALNAPFVAHRMAEGKFPTNPARSTASATSSSCVPTRTFRTRSLSS